MNKLDWLEFEGCITNIYEKCKEKTFVGVYGHPRGGLCLAVALSHSLNIPLLNEPRNNSLIVDDIYETGCTIEKFRNLKDTETHVWISKKKPTWWKAYQVNYDDEWVIFPWEDAKYAETERELYLQSRAKLL